MIVSLDLYFVTHLSAIEFSDELDELNIQHSLGAKIAKITVDVTNPAWDYAMLQHIQNKLAHRGCAHCPIGGCGDARPCEGTE